MPPVQSCGFVHFFPSVHGAHAAPPQSTSVSVPSMVLLLQDPPPELVEVDVLVELDEMVELDELIEPPPMPPIPELVDPDELTEDPPVPELEELDDMPPAPPCPPVPP